VVKKWGSTLGLQRISGGHRAISEKLLYNEKESWKGKTTETELGFLWRGHGPLTIKVVGQEGKEAQEAKMKTEKVFDNRRKTANPKRVPGIRRKTPVGATADGALGKKKTTKKKKKSHSWRKKLRKKQKRKTESVASGRKRQPSSRKSRQGGCLCKKKLG